MDAAINELRHKFAEDLEDILQCPICYDWLTETVPMCAQGHHVCVKCLGHLRRCPLCQGDFNGSRSYLAESLVQKFNDLKLALVNYDEMSSSCNDVDGQDSSTATDQDHDGQQLDRSASQETQTDESFSSSDESLNEPLRLAPSVGTGKYPCRIGDCRQELAHGRMIPHIKYYHPEALIMDKTNRDCGYEFQWTLLYDPSTTYSQALALTKMGLFFFRLAIGQEGEVRGHLRVVNTRLRAAEFRYTLEITNGRDASSYTGPVLGCRGTRIMKNTPGLFVNHSTMTYIRNGRNKFFCNLKLKRLSYDEMLNAIKGD
ncbi:uncharacterized protein LOC106655547 [Trichogramma pretiosum]|uniref:uncharacterized protein LOC106655547 n=1 Tax=Trichogramma pretiosum TaxID=7493 RepID=UPI0006C94D0A|nr:uncharacterized protein LOC106655547 [Trichogramma pretiosum]